MLKWSSTSKITKTVELRATFATGMVRRKFRANSDTSNSLLPESDSVLSNLRLSLSGPLSSLCSRTLFSPYVVNEEVEQWRACPLEAVYPVVWLDGIVVKVHQDHQVVNKTIYLALAINMNGYKELLGIWIAAREGSKFWAKVLTEMNNRGVKDVFVFCIDGCIDGVTGFPDAIRGIYPKSDIQLCIVYMIRNSLKYVSNKNRKEVVVDLKPKQHY